MIDWPLADIAAGPRSYLGIVEGLPEILTHSATSEAAEHDLVLALEDWLQRQLQPERTRIELDDFPTVRVVRIELASHSL